MTPRDPNLTLSKAIRIFCGWTTPCVILALLLLSLTARVLVAPLGWTDLLVVGCTLVIYPLFEWCFHRFVLHSRPVHVFGKTYYLNFGQKHRLHHIDPHDHTLWAMPVSSSLTLFAGVAVVAFLVLSVPTTLSVLVTVLMFALAYEWTHYVCHSSYKPKTRVFRRLQRSHRLHHFKNENYWYGVMTSVGDIILGTWPKKSRVETSPTCRTLW